MPHHARPIGLPARVLGLALVALLLAPSVAVATPLLADDVTALGRQQAVAISRQVVVTWTAGSLGASEADRRAALRQASRTRRVADASGTPAHFVREFGTSGRTAVYRLEEPLGRRAGRTIDDIARLPGVEAVEPDPWVTIDTVPNDTYAGYVWGALGPGDATIFGPAATYGTNADDAWSTTTGSGVRVAVIDTGWIDHADLTGQKLPGYDFITDPWTANDGNGRDSDPSDAGDWITAEDATASCPEEPFSTFHGMHVSGTIAALANNAKGTFGVAPGAKILPLRVLGRCGGSMTDITDAITWARGGAVPGVAANANPVDVINMSLGGQSTCPSYLQAAITSARAAGVVVAVAAGNSAKNASLFAPANCSGSLVVAATDISGKRAAFSNYGTTVDVAAPGVDIASTYNAGTTTPVASPGGDQYVLMQGTSMATPHVAAVAALLFEDHPGATAAQVEGAITGGVTAFPVDPAVHACSTAGTCGSGIANAPAALAWLASIDEDPPVATVTRPAQFTNAAAPVWAVTFDEAVTGLAAADFLTSGTATGCTLQAPTGSGAAWSVAVSGCSEGTVTLTLGAATVADAFGNLGPTSSVAAQVATIDRTAPVSAGSIAAGHVTGTSVTVDFTASDAAAGVATVEAYYSTSPALTSPVECASASLPGASGSFTCTIPATDATYHIYTRATDDAGNTEAVPGTADDSVVRDTTGPTATVIAPASPTNAATLTFSVSFSDIPTGFTSGDLVRGGTAAGCSVGALSGSGTSWTLPLTGCSEGTATLTLGAGTVTDTYGNPGPASAAASDSVTIDRTPPSSSASIATTTTAGTSFDVDFTANDAASALASVTVYRSTSAGLDAPVACGTSSGPATSGTIACTIPATDATWYVWSRATDAAGNTEPSPGSADDAIERNSGPPTATLTPAEMLTNGAGVTFDIEFSEPVTGLAADDFTTGGTAGGCVVGSPTGSAASWAVEVSGCSEGTLTLTLLAGAVTDGQALAGPAQDEPAPKVTIDRTAPWVSAPSVTPRKGQRLVKTAVPVKVSWSGGDAGGSGIASYALQRSTDGGVTWTTVVTTGATSATTTQATSGTVRFRVIATDRAGSQTTGGVGVTTRASLVQTSGVTFARSWSKRTASRYSGGSTKWSKTSKASATYTFTGRGIAFVTTRASTRGKVRIYVGGKLQGTYDLRGATAYRLIAWRKTWPTTARRTVKIVVLATAGRPRVDVDAFVVLK